MGLLDNVLGDLAGGGGSSPVKGVLMSLLAGQGGSQGGAQGGTQGGGGLAGEIGNMLGAGQAPAPGVAANGLSSLVSRFEQAGLGQVVQSWVGQGGNQPVSPQQVEHALGPDQVQTMANQTGMQKNDLLAELAQALPGLVDRLTPQGRLPTAQEMQGGGNGAIEV